MFEPKRISFGGADITISSARGGNGTSVAQKADGVDGVTVTCTCYDKDKSYSTTKTCSGVNNTCDCSTPTSPQIICG